MSPDIRHFDHLHDTCRTTDQKHCFVSIAVEAFVCSFGGKQNFLLQIKCSCITELSNLKKLSWFTPMPSEA
jgi:hypothetical protein